MASGYWQTALDQRITRRRALAVSGATAAAAIFMACSGSDDKTEKDSKGSNQVTQAKDDTNAGKAGGPMKGANLASTSGSWEPYVQGGGSGQGTLSRLFRVKDGHFKIPDGEIEGDLVSSWEVSPDHLTITAKLDPSESLHPSRRSTVESSTLKMSSLATTEIRWFRPAAPITGATSRQRHLSNQSPQLMTERSR